MFVIGLLASVFVVMSILWLLNRPSSTEATARHKLDNLLGQSSTPPVLIPQPPEPRRLPDFSKVFGLGMPETGVKIEETESNYTLRVPLADPNDATQVQLDVTPHRIAISGQTGRRDNGLSVTSSFMQSFSTSQEVLPDQISRKMEKHDEQTELVITIPKKAGATSTPTAPSTKSDPQTPNQPASPELPKELLDDSEHRVI
jgi:hypothetical protein